MAFAASNTTIIFQQFPADSPSLILSSLVSIFAAAGWSGLVSINGGYQFVIQSPPGQTGLPSQNLGARVNVFIDPNFSISGIPQVGIQVLSLDQERLGFIHHLQGVPGRILQCWANCCQFFISQPGVALDAESGEAYCACAGGVPYIPFNLLGVCGRDIGPALTTEAWWSGGDEDSENGTNFRFATTCNPFSACYNANLLVSQNVTTYTPRSILRLFPMALCVAIGDVFGPTPRTRWWSGGTNINSMFFDPLIGWGTGPAADSLALVRGQLWDSFIVSTEQLLDDIVTVSQLTYINYTQDTDPSRAAANTTYSRYMALFLLQGIPSNIGFNYMY